MEPKGGILGWSVALILAAVLISTPAVSSQAPAPNIFTFTAPPYIPAPISAPPATEPVAAPTSSTPVPAAAPTALNGTLMPVYSYNVLNATCYLETYTQNVTCPGCLLNTNLTCPTCPKINVTLSEIQCRPNRTWPFSWSYWTTNLYQILNDEEDEVQWAGVNWMGAETPKCVPHGLDKRSYISHLDQMQGLRFNMIRYAISGSIFNGMAAGVNSTANPDIWNQSCIVVLDKIIEAAFERRIRIIIDYHKIRADVDPRYGLWFDAISPESTWIQNLVYLAARYANNPTVVGIDLFNTPRWSPINDAPDYLFSDFGGQLNFRHSAEIAARAIQEVNPDVLICVSGMQYQDPMWPGGDLERYRYLRINLTANQQKVIYTFQEFGPMTNMTWPWMNVVKAPFFPQNMPDRWLNQFGFMHELVDGAPIWLNSWGSKWNLTDPIFRREQEWAYAFIDYISNLRIPWTWQAWTADDPLTGGILFEDGFTANINKTQLLSTMMYPYPLSPKDDKPNGPLRPPSPPPRAPFIRFNQPNVSAIYAPVPAPVFVPESQVPAPAPAPNVSSAVREAASYPLLCFAAVVTLAIQFLFA